MSEGQRRRAPSGAELPMVDLEACELDALLDLLWYGSEGVVRHIADGLPRPVPPKRRRNANLLRHALLDRWAHQDCRQYYVDTLLAFGKTFREGVHRREGVRDLLRRGLRPNTLMYFAHVEGLDTAKVLAAMPAAARRLFVEQQERLRDIVGALRRQAERKREDGAAAARNAARKEAEQRSKALRAMLDSANRKRERAQQAVAETAARGRERAEELERELERARSYITSLEAENRSLRAIISDLKELRASTHEAAVECQTRHTLSGLRVLVVGDDHRIAAYREIVEEFGGEMEFLSGFSEPRRVRDVATGADFVALVTAYVSHKVSGVVDACGRPVVRVNAAGERSMREALGAYALTVAGRPQVRSPAATGEIERLASLG